MINENELNNLINELFEYYNEDKKVSIETSTGDKITIEIDKKNDNVDSDLVVNYFFIFFILIVLICFIIGLLFKNKK